MHGPRASSGFQAHSKVAMSGDEVHRLGLADLLDEELVFHSKASQSRPKSLRIRAEETAHLLPLNGNERADMPIEPLRVVLAINLQLLCKRSG
jgi:hypothetical protein